MVNLMESYSGCRAQIFVHSNILIFVTDFQNAYELTIINLLTPKWHLWIFLCLTSDDFTRQWGTRQE